MYLFKPETKDPSSPQVFCEKQMVAVIGPLGSGKSTLVNYLLGHKFKMTSKINTDGKHGKTLERTLEISTAKPYQAIAVMGRGFEATTLSPQFFYDDQITLVDCPGLGGERTKMHDLPDELLNAKKFFSRNPSVAAYVVVIDYNALSLQRSELIKKFTADIFDIIPEFNANKAALILACTHLENERDLMQQSPDIQKNTILSFISDLLSFFEKESNHGVQKQKPLSFLQALEKAIILPVSHLDDGLSRNFFWDEMDKLSKQISHKPICGS